MPPAVSVDRNGSRIVDRSKRDLLLSGVGDNPTTLGRYFFTAAYLMVDHDAESFTMWQANPSARTSLVPVVRKATGNRGDCEEGGEGAGGDSGAGGEGEGNGGNGGGGGTNASTDETAASSVNTGAIAGGVVGSVAALAVLAALVFFLLRRKKKQDPGNQPQLPEMASPAGHTGGADNVYYYKTTRSGLQEAPGAELSPGELHGVSSSSYGGATWAITASGMPPESRATYEMDGEGLPLDYTTQGHPRLHSDWH